jgi:hypothetical protein
MIVEILDEGRGDEMKTVARFMRNIGSRISKTW